MFGFFLIGFFYYVCFLVSVVVVWFIVVKFVWFEELELDGLSFVNGGKVEDVGGGE